MTAPDSLTTYLRTFTQEMGERILQSFPPLHAVDDPPSPIISQLLRKPYAAQALAIMGLVCRWRQARAGAVIAECGTGKTLVSLGAVHTHAENRPFTALAMVPPMLTEKWARESLLTLPRVRVFLLDGLRTPTSAKGHYGVNEVKLRNGRIVREGLHTSLTDLRLRKASPSARQRWDEICRCSAVFVVGRDRAKLGYFWRHAYQVSRSGRYRGCMVNPDSGAPVYVGEDEERLLASDFKKAKLSEALGAGLDPGTNHTRRPIYSALWQADGTKTRRFAPVDFIGRYMADGFFDYAIADEGARAEGRHGSG
ncbi:MAG: hypothetical protein ACLQOO_19490 [Terriglobia bacterium]